MAIKSKKTLKTLKNLGILSNKKLTLGNLLWAIRKGDELSQVDFAEKLGVSKQYLCDIENGRRLISPKKAVEYAKILGFSDSQFVRICLQDTIERDGLKFIVDVKSI